MIELTILPHQNDFLTAIKKAFDGVSIEKSNDVYANPIIDLQDEKINNNINELWNGYEELPNIPQAWRKSDGNDYLGLDIKMETGTGKTYCYTRMMYELNQLYGFHKFIILVPTTAIREGSKSFLTADYAKRHFADLYPNKKLFLTSLEAQKNPKGRKLFPAAVAEFVRGTSLEKNKFSVLLMNSGMLLSKSTMATDYDQTVIGTFTKPHKALEATRPVVIIDEPHRFKKSNSAYKTLIKEINPQCIIRFGATFPEIKNNEIDYNNLIFNLNSVQAFNQNLVKGVETYMIDAEKENESKLKLMDFKRNPKVCTFRDEINKKTIEFKKGESLASFGNDFSGLSVDEIGKLGDDGIKSGVRLSNGQVLSKSDIIYGGIYTDTYQELMLKQALVNHFESEKENFMRSKKIKTLSLFFIDSVSSYRDENGGKGSLRLKFEDLLKKHIKHEINNIDKELDTRQDEKLLEYKEYLESSLEDISKTNGGYFSQDNASSDKEIQEEIDKILKDKDYLLNFKDDKGKWNTMRFIFSKWTLKEGWDNPNVFQIVKLRSSGSEISKLQEVGRGLRLPVDEKGQRISDEQFYLKYLIDYSEKDFASKLLDEINSDQANKLMNVKAILPKLSTLMNKDKDDIFLDMLSKKYIDMDGNIKTEKLDDFYQDYPEAINNLKPSKIIDGRKKKNVVNIRKDKFTSIRKLWEKVNQKYYMKFESIPDQELVDALYKILSSDVYKDTNILTKTSRLQSENGAVVLKDRVSNFFTVDEKLTYSEFLKQMNKQIAVPVNLIHQALCKYYHDYERIDDRLFTKESIQAVVSEFNTWLDEELIKKFSYKALDVNIKETSLTNYKGEVVDSISQGLLGLYRDDNCAVPKKFIYDAVVYDSPKEKETLVKSDIADVVVFGKIPRRSIQIPLFTGGTTSPDFMYVINKKDGESQINFIVETKDMKDEKSLRSEEDLRIKSAEKFFETMKEDGVNVVFKKQLKNDDIVSMISSIVKEN